MDSVEVQDPIVLVVAAGDTTSARSNARGHLFEAFIAQLMAAYGFDNPTTSDMNVSSDGIELDLVINSSFMNTTAVCECKAYSSNVTANAFNAFYGKLALRRLKEPEVNGFLFALPRLVAQGEEQVREAQTSDSSLQYINAAALAKMLLQRNLVRDPAHGAALVSDRAIVISSAGIYSAEKILDPKSRSAVRVMIWGIRHDTVVPDSVRDLVGQTTYADGLAVEDEVTVVQSGASVSRSIDFSPPLITTVKGSGADFEYQLPASPKYFIGRRADLDEISKLITGRTGVFVVNAQSGWGKSSLALRVAHMVEQQQGASLVVDTRTASGNRFVAEALRTGTMKAVERDMVVLPEDASWASLSSALATLRRAKWREKGALLIFFDQFENVFQDESITRDFRDLALAVEETSCPLIIGYAWKTDLVSFTESHPYRYRDDIISAGRRFLLRPLGARDVDLLLTRLEKRLGQKLSKDLRQRLREYSQGLPWLFKKLGGHVIAELESNRMSQEALVSEALNVQNLFDGDLRGLAPLENEAIRYIARFAPIAATDVTEKYSATIVQSLLDTRLAVAVGDKIDTYWDTFRDFLNSGVVPIEDSYIVRTNPASVGQLLLQVMEAGGDMTVSQLIDTMGIQEGVIHNRSRELRVFGITAYEPNHVKVLPEIVASTNPEEEIRMRVEKNLRRHRAFSLLTRIAARTSPDAVSLSQYARELPSGFPAVEARPSTWDIYARAFLLWFDYAGLAVTDGGLVRLTPEGGVGRGSLLLGDTIGFSRSRGAASSDSSIAIRSAGSSISFLKELQSSPKRYSELSRGSKRLVAPLIKMELVLADESRSLSIAPGVFEEGILSVARVRRALTYLPGGSECIAALESDPDTPPLKIGEMLRDAAGGGWSEGTCAVLGKHFRAWAKLSGVKLRRRRTTSKAQTDLF